MADQPDEARAAQLAVLEQLNRRFAPLIPFNNALGIEFLEMGDGWALQRLPWSAQLVGDPDTGIIHGGAISALMDSCCGGAAFMAMARPQNLATLDLRIDYLKPATPHLAVHARAECFKRTRQVAFIRCVAYHEDPADPIAMGSAAFVLGTPSGLKGARELP